MRFTFDNIQAGFLSTETANEVSSNSVDGVYWVEGEVDSVNSILKKLYYVPTEDFYGDFSIEVYIETFSDNYLFGIIKVYGISVADSPGALVLSNYKIDKNLAVGSTIGSFSASDPDADPLFTYYFTKGTGDDDNGYFQIAEDKLLLNQSLDWEN